MQPSVSAIVCAYNEESTLGGVVRELAHSALIDDVVVVDDGSIDGTSAVVAAYAVLPKVHAIRLPQNRGKGNAMAEGVELATGDVVVFVDADLCHLNSAHIEMVLRPLLEGEADMVIGYPSREPAFLDRLNLTKALAGQRAVRREDILPLLPDNLRWRKKGRRVRLVRLAGLVHRTKLQKDSLHVALSGYRRAARNIAHTLLDYDLLTTPGSVFGPRPLSMYWSTCCSSLTRWSQNSSSAPRRILEGVRRASKAARRFAERVL